MPKKETIRRIDQRRPTGGPAATPAGAQYSAGGMADKLDGFDASQSGLPYTIPVLDGNGRLLPGMLPEQALYADQATSFPGQWYVAPNCLLTKAISATDIDIVVDKSDLLAVGDNVVLSHYAVPNEQVKVLAGPTGDGSYWRYSIQRNADAGLRYAFPKGSWAINLGADADGGYVVINSGDRGVQTTSAPHINMYAYEEGVARHKLRLGRLRNLSAEFKALFPGVTAEQWDTFGLAASDVFLSGYLYAHGGRILGDLDVEGRFRVKSADSNADVTLGNTAAGWGMTMRNANGQPVWSLITPYTDIDGNQSDVAWIVQSQGERAIYFRNDPVLNDWVLSIGGFDFTADAFTSPGTRLKIDSANERIEFGPVYIKAGDPGTPVLLDWKGAGILGNAPGAVLPIWTDQYNFGDFRVYDWPTSDLGSQALRFRVSQTTGSVYHYGQSYFYDTLHVMYTSETSTKDPATQGPDRWVKILDANGTAYYIPAYAYA